MQTANLTLYKQSRIQKYHTSQNVLCDMRSIVTLLMISIRNFVQILVDHNKHFLTITLLVNR